MADVITYPDALAACVARWGEPAATYRRADRELFALDRWDRGDGGVVWLCRVASGRITITAARPFDVGVPMEEWALTGRAAITVTAALDAADAWRRP